MNVERYAEAGLHGWKGKAGRRAADTLSEHTPFRGEHLKALFGALAFAASLRYVLKTLLALSRDRR